MKLQDKIYVREYNEGIDQMWRPEPSSSTAVIAQHEYIRKDFLTERTPQEVWVQYRRP